MMHLTIEKLLSAARPLIELAIAEDVGPGDSTSLATLDSRTILCGRIVAKSPGVIAGLPVARAVFERIDPSLTFQARVDDGQEVVAGELLAVVVGPAPSLLAAERTALNFLQRMSGIATLTRDFVDAVATTPATILDTRKTAPGHRLLDKYAVWSGGGTNHRLSLFDMVMIKDNHVDGAGGISRAVALARDRFPNLPAEVEVRDLGELAQALAVEPPLDRILLDNMDLGTLQQAVALAAGRVPLEASGGVTLQRVSQIGATGVDYISVGALTHSPRALDISMKVRPPGGPEPEESLRARVLEIKAQLGARLLMLGHHYQRDEIIDMVDRTGDSLQLAREAAGAEAETIVFCGVHFMAEVAAVLAKPGQSVLVPDSTAGCYLADTATLADVLQAWDALSGALGDAETEFTPITYVNSSAGLKAFCGRHGGAVCTSGNAERLIEWGLMQRPRLFFFPDQHLGYNAARRVGIPTDEMLLWNPLQPPGPAILRKARVVLWPGACNVHQRFRPEQVQAARRRFPDARVIVHPECRSDVIDLADEVGSTGAILGRISDAPAGSRWLVGTESRLVRRLQQEHTTKTIRSLAPVPPFCPTMSQTTLANLAWVLEGVVRDEQRNRVIVEEDVRRWARVALDRMLAT